MGNRHRGDVTVELGGRRLTLRLTLGALAEIESAFQTDNLSALGERFAAGLRVRDILVVLGAAARGGGSTLSDHDLAASLTAADLPRLTEALADLLRLTFGGETEAPFRRRG